MKLFLKTFISTTICFFIALPLLAKEILVSKQKGSTDRQKFVSAYEKAQKGDVVIVDMDIVLHNDENPIHIKKNKISIVGKIQGDSLFKITRTHQKNFLFKVSSQHINIKNLQFEQGMQQLYFQNEPHTSKKITIENCYFKNGKYTGINFKGKYKNVLIKNCTFNNTKFSLQTMDCPVLENFVIDTCQFIKGDHQISLDNPHANIVKHKNIHIKNCSFGFASRFNIALANTQNVCIENSNFKGGTGSYAQALHFEDRTKNVLVKNNKIECMADVAILLYATDKIGHGTGRKLTEEEKYASGSGNVTLINNQITSGMADAAISIGYGQGYLKITGDNVIQSKKEAIKSFKSAKNIQLMIDDHTFINGKRYDEIKTLLDSKEKERYLKIK
ncbi:right-handed parallel beta-helix repeat-containing protein [Ochrovirga pacifica]|uniref:right-handed parallel beta-helix repeat-containing protein n=1 Tax=Ochrovirga pacifica TaxID=1042376 RepID=UPI0002559D7E|nr:right-handed parallel beta-helix repeat-containing protein [Ochrovirga pacifica]